MKTNFKNYRILVTIFLAIVISSCQDSLIEQQDYLLSETKQDFSKKPVEYWGRFIAGGFSGPNLLVSLAPAGNSSSLKFTIQWPPCRNPENCDEVFDLTVTGEESGIPYSPNYNVQISLFKKAGKIYGFQMWLHDGDYRFATDKISLNPVIDFPTAVADVVIPINRIVELFRFDNGSGKKHRESVGEITIGSLEYWQK